MALDEDQDEEREDLTAEDNTMLDKVVEVVGPQLTGGTHEMEFSKQVVYEGRKYELVVMVEMICIDASEG